MERRSTEGLKRTAETRALNAGRGDRYEPKDSQPYRPVRRSPTYDDRSIPNRRNGYPFDDGDKLWYEKGVLGEEPSMQLSHPHHDPGLDPYLPPEKAESRRQIELVRGMAARNDRERSDLNHERIRLGVERRELDAEMYELRHERDRLAEASKVLHTSQHVPGIFQTVFDVNHPQDASVHLELPITDDHDTELEVFSRLRRLGDFSAAQDYFKSKLEPYLSNPYVLVHFGQMLLDQGDYLSFERASSQTVFGNKTRPASPSRGHIVVAERRSRPRHRERERKRDGEFQDLSRSLSPEADGRPFLAARESDAHFVRNRIPKSQRAYYGLGQHDMSDRSHSSEGGYLVPHTESQIDYDEVELLRQNWGLLQAASSIFTCSKGHSEHAYTEAWYAIENFRFGAGIGSTEIHIVVLALHLCAHIGRVTPERYYAGLHEAAVNWIRWPALFKYLLVQGRIWDFKDLYVAAVAAFSCSAHELFFGTDDIKRSLIDDWVFEKEDFSTNLAQLSLLLEPVEPCPWFLDEARSRAEAIIACSPAAMKSRPFIRWIIANSVETLYTCGKQGEGDPWLTYKTHLQGFPGLTWGTQGWIMPILYVPRHDENPGWIAPELSPGAIEPLQLALNLAKELMDYKSQTACYRLLISQSQDPVPLFEELAHLLKSKQGDKQAHLETLVASYTACKDRSAKEVLLEQLKQTDDWGDASMLYWARDFIERAVKRSLEGPKSTARLRHRATFYTSKGLSGEAEQFTWLNADLDWLTPTTQYPVEPPSSESRLLPRRRSTQVQGQPSIKLREGPNYTAGEGWHRLPSRLVERSRRVPSVDHLERNGRPVDEKRSESGKKMTDAREKERHLWTDREKTHAIAKRAQNKQDQETRNRRDEEMHKRHEGAESPAQDQTQGVRRVEDWLADNTYRRQGNSPRKVIRFEDVTVMLGLQTTSEFYSGSITSSPDDDDSIDGIGDRRRKQKDKVAPSDDEEALEQEKGLDRARARSDDQRQSVSRKAEDNHHNEDDAKDRHHPLRTYEVERTGAQSAGSHDTCPSGSHSQGLPDSPVSSSDGPRPDSGEISPKVSSNTMAASGIVLVPEKDPMRDQTQEYPRGRTDKLPAKAQHAADQCGSRLEGDTTLSEAGDGGEAVRTTTELWPQPKMPPPGFAHEVEDGELLVTEEHSPPRRHSSHSKSTSQAPRRSSSAHDFQGAGTRNNVDRRPEEQNMKIASRPPINIADVPAPERASTHWDAIIAKEHEKQEELNNLARIATTDRYGSPKSPKHERTGFLDGWEEGRREKPHKSVTMDPNLDRIFPAPIRTDSGPPGPQENENIQPPERRTSWRDKHAAFSPDSRPGTPRRRSSVFVDADGRPHLVRTRSEARRVHDGGTANRAPIRANRGEVIDKGLSTAIKEISPTAAGKRPQRPIASRSQSAADMLHNIGPDSSAPEKPSAGEWDTEEDFSLRRMKAMSSLREDLEDGENRVPSKPRPRSKDGESTKPGNPQDPEPGISRKPTVTDPDPGGD